MRTCFSHINFGIVSSIFLCCSVFLWLHLSVYQALKIASRIPLLQGSDMLENYRKKPGRKISDISYYHCCYSRLHKIAHSLERRYLHIRHASEDNTRNGIGRVFSRISLALFHRMETARLLLLLNQLKRR